MKPSKSPLLYQMGGYTPTQLTDASFIPTYVGTPLEDAQRYGTDLLNTYKQNIADLTKLDIANAQRRVLPGDAAESAKYDAELKAQFEEMAKKGDYENMTHQVNELARRHVNNKRLKIMAENFAEGEKAQAHAQALRDKGLAPLFYNDPNKFQSITYDDQGNEQLNRYVYEGEAPLAWRQERQDIWNTVKPNVSQLSKSQVNSMLNALDGYIATGQWKGISDNRVTNLMEHAIKTYEATPHYKQELRALLSENGGDEEAAKKELRARMSSEGILHTFNEVHPNYLQDWQAKYDATHGTNLFNPETEGLPGVSVGQVLGFDPEKWNPNPYAVNNYKPGESNLSGAPGDPYAYSAAEAWKSTDPAEQKKNQEELTAYRTAVTDGLTIFDGPEAAAKFTEQGTKGYKTLQAYEAAVKMQKLMQNRLAYPSVKGYPTEMQHERSGQIKRSLGSRLFWDMDNNVMIPTHAKGSQTQVNPDLLKMMGNEKKNLEAVGELNPKNPYYAITKNPAFADAELVQVTDEDGATRNLLVSKPQGYYGTPIAGYKQLLNQVWSEVALKPGSKKTVEIAGVPIEFSVIPAVDANGEASQGPFESTDKVTIYKIGDHDFTTDDKGNPTDPLTLQNGYDELAAKIYAYKHSK